MVSPIYMTPLCENEKVNVFNLIILSFQQNLMKLRSFYKTYLEGLTLLINSCAIISRPQRLIFPKRLHYRFFFLSLSFSWIKDFSVGLKRHWFGFKCSEHNFINIDYIAFETIYNQYFLRSKLLIFDFAQQLFNLSNI